MKIKTILRKFTTLITPMSKYYKILKRTLKNINNNKKKILKNYWMLFCHKLNFMKRKY